MRLGGNSVAHSRLIWRGRAFDNGGLPWQSPGDWGYRPNYANIQYPISVGGLPIEGTAVGCCLPVKRVAGVGDVGMYQADNDDYDNMTYIGSAGGGGEESSSPSDFSDLALLTLQYDVTADYFDGNVKPGGVRNKYLVKKGAPINSFVAHAYAVHENYGAPRPAVSIQPVHGRPGWVTVTLSYPGDTTSNTGVLNYAVFPNRRYI
jgi:hypothetical protein